MIVKKSWFFIITKTAISRGTRFRLNDRPNEETMQNLVDTVITKNIEDKAKESSSEPVESLVGHVVASTSLQAIAFQAVLTDRTLAVQPHQLPETVKDADTVITLTDATYGATYTDPILDVSNVTPTTRNVYKHKITAGFSGWLGGILSNISIALKNNIIQTGTNTSNIASNTAAISGLTGGTFNGSIPIGAGVEYYGVTDPNANFFIQDGRSLLRTSYPALFAIMGVTQGQGASPGTTFALPNKKGKTSKGLDITNPLCNVIGKIGGLDSKMLTIYDLPAHKHPAKNNSADINIVNNVDLADVPVEFGAHAHKAAFGLVGFLPNFAGSGADNIGDGGDSSWKSTTQFTTLTTNGGIHKHSNKSFSGSVGFQYDPAFTPQTALDFNSPFVTCNFLIRVL